MLFRSEGLHLIGERFLSLSLGELLAGGALVSLSSPAIRPSAAPRRSALGLYLDDEFELQLWRGEIEGVPIDVSQAEEAYALAGGRRVPLGTSLAHRQRARVLDIEVWVQPLAELIAYKELLGRSADLADLRRLQGSSAGPGG